MSLRTVDSLLQRGEINHIRIGAAIRVKPAELHRFIEARETRRQPIQQRRMVLGKGGAS